MVRCLLALHTEKGINLHVVAVVRNVQKQRECLVRQAMKSAIIPMTSLVLNHSHLRKDRLPLPFCCPTASKDFVEHPVETMNTVYGGMQNLLSYAHQHGVTSMVLASTLEVYGTVTDDRHPLTEDMQGLS